MSIFRSSDDYTVGWICALPLELAAAQLVLDNIHPSLPQSPEDHNTYLLGDIKGHNVVVACLPSGNYGTTPAAVVASTMLSTYHKIRFGLLVGIGGGVPSSSVDIRLGDVVVSKPTGVLPGVIQYDLGKTLQSGKLERVGSLNQPALPLLTALAQIEGRHWIARPEFHNILSHAMSNAEMNPDSKFQYPGLEQDRLFQSDYTHPDDIKENCRSCDNYRTVSRQKRNSAAPRVHYGLIASGNQVMKDACTRDRLATDLGVLCFEMEAAGLMNHFPCLVIRGICDYADSHKNDQWQGYSAMAAAAYSKELLSAISIAQGRGMVPSQLEISTNARDDFSVGFAHMYKPSMPFFIGREQELEKIRTELQAQSSRRTVVLYGLGGMGKTQLALAYAMQNLTAYTAVFWFDATNEQSLAKDFLKMAERILADHPHLVELERIREKQDAASAVKWAKKWLSSRGNDNWLLIYDNYEPTPEFVLESFQPNLLRGHTIITTRDPKLRFGQSILVSKIQNIEQNREILLRQPGPSDPTGNLTLDPDLDELVIKLDGLPSALASAGRCLKITTMSCGDYARKLDYRESYGDEDLEQSSALEHREQPSALEEHGQLEMTWSISRDHMCQEPGPKFLLSIWGGLDSRDLWYELLESASHSLWQEFQAMSRTQFHDAMKTLCDYGFAEFGSVPDEHTDGSRGYTLHRCVHRWMIRTTSTENFEIMAHTGLIIVNTHSERVSGIQRIETNRRLLGHANHLLHISNAEFAPMRFRYEFALQMKALSTVFRTNRNWYSSPQVTFWLNIFHVNHPNLDKEANSLRIVVSLCQDSEDEKFQKLHRDALYCLSGLYLSKEIFQRIKKGWLENKDCRASSHPAKYTCPRCSRNLYTDILPMPLFFTMVLWWIILTIWSILILPFKGQISSIASYLSNFLIFSIVPRWKYRRTAFVLGILLKIGNIIYNWYVLEVGKLIVLLIMNDFLIIFGNLPMFYVFEGISLVQLSGLSSHLQSGEPHVESRNSHSGSGTSRVDSRNSRLETAFVRMGDDVSNNVVTVYWVVISILFFINFLFTLPLLFAPRG